MVALAVVAGATIVPFLAQPATAHEERDEGKYVFAVGFGTEPAYAGQLNSVQLLLSDGSGHPVAELRSGLEVSVSFGDQTQSYPIEPNFEVGEFGTPGDYRAWFIPTRPGQYAFHFTGTVNGQQVDETFRSGPRTFDDVHDPSEVEFPVKDPSVGEVAERIDREVPRLESSIDEVRATAASTAASASDDASSARTLAVVALAVGALGLVVGVAALFQGRRRPA
jgi:hypothetical protein